MIVVINLLNSAMILRRVSRCCKHFNRCHSYKSFFPTRFYDRKRLQRIEHEQFVEGPPPSWPRCFFPNWNPVSELRAFAFRINEPMNIGFLRVAFTDKSYVDIPPEELSLRKLKSFPNKDNSGLSENGETRLRHIVTEFLRETYPKFPSDAIEALTNFLVSPPQTSYLAKNLGIDDLLIASMYPYPDDVLHRAFCALVETLHHKRSSVHAKMFVFDFVCSQLIHHDVIKLWNLSDPELRLNEILASQNRPAAEPRLIYQASVNSVLPLISVGFFSDKKFLGSGSGETVEDARKEAARSCLREVLDYNWECHESITCKLDRIESD